MASKTINSRKSVKEESGKTAKQARFDARLSQAKKDMFEKAAAIAGYKSLSEFIFSSATERAQKILQINNAILASEKDNEIFFDAILNPPQPSEALIKAVQKYSQEE